MPRRFFLSTFVVILILAAIGGYFLYSYNQTRILNRRQRQNAKAPDQAVILIEGWDIKDIAENLGKKGIVKAGDFLAAEKNFDVSGYPIIKSSKPKTADLEGFIFPDTYFIPVNRLPGQDISQIIIQKALDNFSQKITAQIQEQAAASGLSFYQIVTLASIIEKESGTSQDRPKIAGVFYNRLKANMPLQSDATINFFTGKNDPQASLADIGINNIYNTYIYKGLPPGPICNPSLSSLLAAVNPTSSDYLYFLSDPKTGQAVFAKTYDEHLANKTKYLK
jgi:UPF0755 protein